MKGNREVPHNNYLAQPEGRKNENPRAGGKGRNGAISLEKGQFHSN